MSELTRAYNNFLKYEEEKQNRDKSLSTAKASTGLLAPKTSRPAKRNNSSSNKASELDKVAEYVSRIRKYRKA
jgi:hypothetical protein